MSLAKLQAGLAAAIVAAGTGGYLHQQQLQAELRDQLATATAADAEAARLRQANRGLQRAGAEVARLREDDAELVRLRDEAAALNHRLQEIARAAAARRAQTSPTVAATKSALPAAAFDAMPTPTFQTPPVYPAELRNAGVSGSANISFIVAADGTVQDVRAVKSSHPAFEAPAVEAVQQWQFAPGLKGGRAVNTAVTVPIVFQLKDGAITNWF